MFRLLFDENLAPRLVNDFVDTCPDSTHVLSLGLGGANDWRIWSQAASEELTLVTKDEDFHRFSVLYSPPPKVIWIRLGNCATADVARLLRLRAKQVQRFIEQEEASFLILG